MYFLLPCILFRPAFIEKPTTADEWKSNTNIIHLDKKTINLYIEENENMMILFYAPCELLRVHCMQSISCTYSLKLTVFKGAAIAKNSSQPISKQQTFLPKSLPVLNYLSSMLIRQKHLIQNMMLKDSQH